LPDSFFEKDRDMRIHQPADRNWIDRQAKRRRGIFGTYEPFAFRTPVRRKLHAIGCVRSCPHCRHDKRNPSARDLREFDRAHAMVAEYCEPREFHERF
jgi:hypothetical protein